jgi:hypothetical protein
MGLARSGLNARTHKGLKTPAQGDHPEAKGHAQSDGYFKEFDLTDAEFGCG